MIKNTASSKLARITFYGSFILFFLMVLLYAFKWHWVDLLTIIIFFPLLGFAWIVYSVWFLLALWHVKSEWRNRSSRSFIPIGVLIVTLALVQFVPFNNIWIEKYYSIYRQERVEIVKKIQNGEIEVDDKFDFELIQLGDGYPNLSLGGNEIVVQTHSRNRYVFFYSFRGILDNYSGFLYVPPGETASGFSDLNEETTQILELEPNWFYVSHR